MHLPDSSSPSDIRPDGRVGSVDDDDSVLVDELAQEFANRLREGERVTIDDYKRLYPQLAEEIDELFPAIMAMERLTNRQKASSTDSAGLKIKQLGDYRIIGEIARGGMGIVYEAEQVSLGRRVAMKVLPSQSLRSKNELLRFQRESRTAAKLHHTNIVPVFSVGEQDGYHYIVMQYIEGVGLDEILDELRMIVLNDVPQHSATSARSDFAKRNARALLTHSFHLAHGTHRNTETAARQTTVDVTPTSDVLDSSPSDRVLEQIAKQSGRLLNSQIVNGEYWQSVADIGAQAADALAHAHANETLHRDVKPGNLLLDVHGVVWVADFGLAKAVDADGVTWTGDIVGTISYMAPERFEDMADARSDIYGLGLTLYELVTFQRAFEGSDRASLIHRVLHEPIQPPRKINPNVPRDLETIIMKATSREPDDRYQSAAAMADDLRRFLMDLPISARRMNPLERWTRWCRRNRAIAALTATVATLLVVMSVLAMAGFVRENHLRQRAEDTSQLAVNVLDQIYGHFAPTELDVPRDIANLEDTALSRSSEVPLSSEVALALEKLLVFYDRLSSQSENSVEVMAKSLSASRRVGDIRLKLGEPEKALAAYGRAIDSVQDIYAATESVAPDITIEHARVLNGMGQAQRKLRQWKDAAESHQKAIEVVEGIDLPDAKFELARGLSFLQRVDMSGDRKKHVTRAISTLEELVTLDDHKPYYSLLLARCLSCNFVPGQKCETRKRAQRILEDLVTQYPSSPEYRYELGWVYSKAVGCCEESEELLRKADEVTKMLDVSYPNIPDYLKLKSYIYYSLAKALHSQNRLLEAVDYFSLAIEKERLLLDQQPDNPRRGNRLASLFMRRADVQTELGDVDTAKVSLESAITLLEPLARDMQNSSIEFSTELLADARRRLACLE